MKSNRNLTGNQLIIASKLPCVPLLSMAALIRGNNSEFTFAKGAMPNNAGMGSWYTG